MNILKSSLYKDDLKRTLDKLNLSQLKGKKILITGGLGLICSAAVDLLIVANQVLQLDIHIYVAARSRSKFDDRFGDCENVTYVQYDANKNVHFSFHADYIIHGASLASPEKYTAEPVETMLSNIYGIINLLRYAEKEKTERVLYISSSEVYGKKRTNEPFIEDVYGSVNLDSLRSSYAVSKQASELLCKAFSAEYGVDTVIVRPGHIFGPSASVTDKRVSSDFAFKAANHEPIVLKSSGLQKRSYCYSVDAAASILMVLLRGKKAEAYNIGTKEVLTIREMAENFARAGNVPLKYAAPTDDEIATFNPMNDSSLNCDKLYAMGFQNLCGALEAMEHTVKILQECKESG